MRPAASLAAPALAALPLAALAALGLPGAAAAATLGLPVFAAPATGSVVNEFDCLGLCVPSGLFTLSLATTVASADGAPELVGEGLSLSFTGFRNGDGTLEGDAPTFTLGSPADLAAGGGGVAGSTFVIFPPDFTESLDPEGHVEIEFGGIFAGFDPAVMGDDEVPAVELLFVLSDPLPERTGYVYCQVADPDACEFSNLPGLTEVGGEAASLFETIDYVEGPLTGTITFYTVGGRPIPPIPLPAGAWLLAGALAGLAALRARRG